MLFNSIAFLVFFPVVAVLYFYFPPRFRWGLLLVASCIFYIWYIPKYILILAALTICDYIAAILIEDNKKHKKKFLVLSIVCTCLILFVFKYFYFFAINTNEILRFLGSSSEVPLLNYLLPIGLSFHTFQSLSYVMEVYRENQKAERNFGIYSLYVMFFPCLVAGPIERPQNLLHQFRENHLFSYDQATRGLKLIAWGLFKKIVIADRLALFVNSIYDQPNNYQGFALIIATIFFAFQIYCDFSGYSDMAIGVGEVMGFKLMTNFNSPYFSKTIAVFWSRWHISLSTWFRDYLYIPLGGNRCSKWRWQFNLLITFLLSGFWHGANWTYVVWGGLNGLYLIISNLTHSWQKVIRETFLKFINEEICNVLQILLTFALICFTWIFFRSRTISDAHYICTHLFEFTDQGNLNYLISSRELMFQVTTGALLIFLLLLIEYIKKFKAFSLYLLEGPLIIRWSIYYALIFSIFFLRVDNKVPAQFIYFQF
jgi:alginate O-acetyltransferase complex protein AlgI